MKNINGDEQFSFTDVFSEYTFGVYPSYGELYVSITRKQYHPILNGHSTITCSKKVDFHGEITWCPSYDNLISIKAQDYISNFMIKYFKMKAFW